MNIILVAEEWESVNRWVISQVMRWIQSSHVADYSSSPFEQTRQRQQNSPLEERQGRSKAETLEGPPYSPLRISVLEPVCSSDVDVLNLKPFPTLAINFNCNAWSIRGNFHRCSESHRVALGTGCSFLLCRRPERVETNICEPSQSAIVSASSQVNPDQDQKNFGQWIHHRRRSRPNEPAGHVLPREPGTVRTSS